MNGPSAPDRQATATGRGFAPVDGTAGSRGAVAGQNAPWGVFELVVRYGDHIALDGVSLEVPAGVVTAVVGADGSGKSSLLKALAGAIRPESGDVRRPDRRHLGFVSTDRGVYRDLTAVENLRFAGRAYGLRDEELDEKVEATLRRIGLEGAERRLAARLSGGMRQKLAVAMALLHDPALLVLDEPTTGIDPLSRVELWELIAEIAASGTAVALATSYVDEAERAARVLVLSEGRQLAAGSPEEIAAAMPGSVWTSDRRLGDRSWRRGASWRIWIDASSKAPAGAVLAMPDLEDALVVAELEREPAGAASGATGSDTPRAAADPDAASLLAVRRIGQRFGQLQALEDVDLDVQPGEVVGLIGANGAGKTTLIRIAMGVLLPTSGEASLFGEVPSREMRRRVGYMPQGLGLYDDLTVGENLSFVARSFGVADAPATDSEVTSSRDRLVGELPLGVRRRVAFAATLSHCPELLVLDEPTSGVGALGRARLWELIRSAAEAGSGVLVTTHSMSEASQCDRLVVLMAGRVAARGTAAEIAAGLVTQEVFAEPWDRPFRALKDAGLPVALAGRRIRIPGADRAAVLAALATAGVEAEVRPSPASFEEAFVLLARGDRAAV
jgi:ABC-2 type transport system ATP-binding protein